MAKKAHFIGICGVGMSAAAKLLKDLKWDVSGSDDGFYPPGSELVKRYDIAFHKGYKKENIPSDVDLIVIGKNAKLTVEENEEVKAAFEHGASVRSFPEVLEQLTEGKNNIVAIGSYGKSTCSSLLSWCLLKAGKDPSYFVGAIPRDVSMDTAHIGKSDVFILEGDEYPSSNWDNTSKFLHYNASDVLLTSACHDHINVFPTHDEYLAPFKTLLSLIPEDGLLVACADEENAEALANTHTGKKAFYGLDQKSYDISYDFWSAKNITYGETTTFTLTKNNEPVVELTTTLLGKHNIQNIIGISAMLLEKQLLTPEELAAGIKTFRGIRRRLDLLSEKSSVRVYEGFGSSYEKARAALSAMKLHFPDKRLITVFEPHTFSWRNKDALSWYDDVFAGSDLVLVYEPATQGAATHKQLTQEEIVDRIKKMGITTQAISSKREGLDTLKKELKKDDVVLLMTSGGLGGLISSIPELVDEMFPK